MKFSEKFTRYRKIHGLKADNNVERFAWIFLSIASIIFLFPMFAAVMVSISSQESIGLNGYQLIPTSFSFDAYELLFKYYGYSMGRAVVLTVGTGLVQPLLSMFLCVCLAYPLSQPDFWGRDFWRKYLVFTMLFSGGLVPTYILKTRYMHLKNTIWIYVLPGVGAWTVFLFRTFFTNIDKSMVESAKIDGASNFRILLSIMLPLTKPLVAMNFFSGFLGRWNDITTPLYYITKPKLYTIQYLLQSMLSSATTMKELIEQGLASDADMPKIPIDATRFALAVIGALPVFILFPYIQKYYAKGIMVGSTKG